MVRSLIAIVLAMVVISGVPLAAREQEPGRCFHILAASFVTLTVLDSTTTTIALQHGLVEKNAVLRSFASNTPVLFTTKAITAVGTVYLTHRLQRTHPRMSTILLIAINVVTGFVVVSNVRAIQQSEGR